MIVNRNHSLRTLSFVAWLGLVGALCASVTAQAAAPNAAASSAPVTVTATRRLGTSEIDVRGIAPAGVSVRVTLTGQIARDLPVVVIARAAVVAGSDGTYAVRFPTGSLSFPNSLLIATTEVAGSPPLRSTMVVSIPDPTFNSPNNNLPPDK